jgi:transposase-like protein
MDREQRRLKSRIKAAPVNNRGCRRFEPELRATIAEHARRRNAEGESQASVAEDLGISEGLLWKWMQNAAPPVREVTLGPDVDSSTRGSDRRLRLPNGIELCGLELEELIAIARALS